MKTRKFLLFILAIALISSLLVIVPSADNGKLSINEDYSTVTYNGNQYVYFPELTYADMTETLYSNSDFSLTEKQQREISSITAYVREGVYLRLSISFNKGGYLNDYYINVDYIDDYQSFVANGGSQYSFYDYESYENVYIDRNDVFKTSVVLNSYELLYYGKYAEVTTTSADGYFREQSGNIICDNEGNYYYYDFRSSDGDQVTLWKLDKSIFEEEDILDVTYEGNDFILGFSAVVLSLFFGAIPLAALIVCLILSFKSKQPYRRGLRITAILCAVELVTFIATMILLLTA